jgi:hypothetical protein
MSKHTDLWGDEHEVSAGILPDTGERLVWYDVDRYTPEQARALAADLIAAADALSPRLLALQGGTA